MVVEQGEKDALSCAGTMSGVLSVTTTGEETKPMWFADSLAIWTWVSYTVILRYDTCERESEHTQVDILYMCTVQLY